MILDLFAGAGGFTLGTLQAGLDVAISVDYDRDLTSSHSENFESAPLLLSDLTTLSPKRLLKSAGVSGDQVNGIVGGPPCQGFSNIGRRVADDPRNILAVRFFEFVQAIKPGFFIFENVPGLLDKRFAATVDAALSLIPEEYDVVGPTLLNAKDFGAATSRARVVVIGVPSGSASRVTAFLKAKTAPATVSDAIDDLPSPIKRAAAGTSEDDWPGLTELNGERISAYARSLRAKPEPSWVGEQAATLHREGKVTGFGATRHSAEVVKRFKAVQPGGTDSVSKFPRLSGDTTAPTLRAGTGRGKGCYQSVRPIHHREPRVITIREAARIQSFPDWFLFHRTKWHSFRMIGNSIPPMMARRLIDICAAQI